MTNETGVQQKNVNTITDNYPSTWPAAGPIDLNIHDLPHHASVIEWWYQNCHLISKSGKRFSLFASFFRLAMAKDDQTGNITYTHSVIWSLSDITDKKYYSDSLVDPCTPAEILKMINKTEEKKEPGTINKSFLCALKEVYEKGNVPLPDRLLKQPANVSTEQLSLEYDENTFKKDEHGNYHLTLENPLNGIACKLRFTPQTNVIRHGNNGSVVGIRKEDMFYYFIPKCNVIGDIYINSQIYEVEGDGWYDHEFGKPMEEINKFEFKHDMAWNWVALQLDNGCQLSGYDLFDNNNNRAHAGGTMIIIDKAGKKIEANDYSFAPETYWTSARTFVSYPVSWLLEIPSLNISLSLKADFPEQEFITILSAPAFWEGSVNAVGSFTGIEVSGRGYIERNGFNIKENIESFLKAVGKVTQRTIESLLPLTPTDDQFYKLVNSPMGVGFFSTSEKEEYVTSVIKPIREIVDRSRKAWRSYIFLACIDIVGGDSQPFIDWMAMPELIHTGSLIIDDVQDRSDTRRGGTALHQLYGEPLAINAGNACYFIGELFTHNPQLSVHIRLKIYELYFEMMRAAHAGQAMDIAGLHSLMPDTVKSGNSSVLEKRIYATHRLKTATPACTLAKMGGLIGGGRPEETDALGVFFEAIGVAYQVMDDVLNLQGFENDLKDKGEDITAGKITMPVAKAMSLLPLDKREYVWTTVKAMPKDKTVIGSVISLLQSCGAIEACRQEADDLVEAAWIKIDKILPDSFYKIRLRTFGRYALKKE